MRNEGNQIGTGSTLHIKAPGSDSDASALVLEVRLRDTVDFMQTAVLTLSDLGAKPSRGHNLSHGPNEACSVQKADSIGRAI